MFFRDELEDVSSEKDESSDSEEESDEEFNQELFNVGQGVNHTDDPRWLSSTLAPIPPPPTEKIATELKSRFQ